MNIKRTKGQPPSVRFTKTDFARWRLFIKAFGQSVRMPTKPHKSELWSRFIGEFLVRGGTRGIDRLQKDSKKWKEFLRQTSLKSLSSTTSSRSQLRDALKQTKVTRFWPQAARAIEQCRRNKDIVRGQKFVLLDGFQSLDDEVQMRRALLRRCSKLGPKGASNFLINVGLARDLAAIDTRIIGFLEHHFHAPQEIKRARSSQPMYLALEAALRDVARKNRISLSKLDRTIFQAMGMSAADFLLRS